jgi:hypothetical protein
MVMTTASVVMTIFFAPYPQKTRVSAIFRDHLSSSWSRVWRSHRQDHFRFFHEEKFPMETSNFDVQRDVAAAQQDVQSQAAAVAEKFGYADETNALDGVEIVRRKGTPPTSVPLGLRADAPVAEEEAADAPLGGSAPEEAGEDLAASFDRQYQTVCKIDEAVSRFEIKKRRTPEYWELGRIAAQLKQGMGHGKWLPFLAEHGYAERTIQRATHIYVLFVDRQEECAALTLEQAEQVGKKAKKPDAEPKDQDGGTGQQGTETAPEVTSGSQEAPETEPPLAPPATQQREAETAAEVAGGGGEAQDEEGDEDEAREVKSELLWGILSEASDPGFSISDAEREAFATFMATVGDEDRAVRVMLHGIWNII